MEAEKEEVRMTELNGVMSTAFFLFFVIDLLGNAAIE